MKILSLRSLSDRYLIFKAMCYLYFNSIFIMNKENQSQYFHCVQSFTTSISSIKYINEKVLEMSEQYPVLSQNCMVFLKFKGCLKSNYFKDLLLMEA